MLKNHSIWLNARVACMAAMGILAAATAHAEPTQADTRPAVAPNPSRIVVSQNLMDDPDFIALVAERFRMSPTRLFALPREQIKQMAQTYIAEKHAAILAAPRPAQSSATRDQP